MIKFIPRLSEPSITNKHYLHNTKGGYNPCILIDDKSVLPNCVGYAYGRKWELENNDPKHSTGHAFRWYEHISDDCLRGVVPALGAIICFKSNNSGNGHVAIVEQIQSNGDIVISQSGYNSKRRFYLSTLTKSSGYAIGGYTFQGFIYSKIDFAIEKTNTKSIEKIANEVIMGEWGNGDVRKTSLTKAGYDYNTVQNKVNELLCSTPIENQLKVGSLIRIKASASHYCTGEIIPSSKKGINYTIQQISCNKYQDGILIKEIYSWVNKNDLELI